MKNINILAEIKERLGVSSDTLKLLHKLIESIVSEIEHPDSNLFFRTHKRGVTGYCSPKKAFVFFNLSKSHISAVFWTGKKWIIGLEKANWTNDNDNSGSKSLKIQDNDSMELAVDFALQANKIVSDG